jgi:hypothetical protein
MKLNQQVFSVLGLMVFNYLSFPLLFVFCIIILVLFAWSLGPFALDNFTHIHCFFVIYFLALRLRYRTYSPLCSGSWSLCDIDHF